MTVGDVARREHPPGRLDAAELDVERHEPRTIQRRTGRDSLTLELTRTVMKLLELYRSIRLAVRVLQGHWGRLSRTVGRHAVPIRGDRRVFKPRAALAIT